MLFPYTKYNQIRSIIILFWGFLIGGWNMTLNAQVLSTTNTNTNNASVVSSTTAPTTYCFFQTPINKSSVKCYVIKTRSQRNIDWSDNNKYNASTYFHNSDYNQDNGAMNVESYDVYSGHLNLGTVEEKEYKSNGIPLTTTTQYYYSPLNYQINSITTSQSENGNIVEKKFSYSGNETNAGINNIFLQQNMSSILLSQESSVSNNPTFNGLLGSSTNEFIQLANGDIKPSKTSVINYGAPGVSSNAITEVQNYQYDAAGNMICVQGAGRTVSYIYDYDDKFAVATIVNADATLDKPAYSSFETDKLGGWTMAGTPTYSTTQYVTGSRSLQMTSSLSANINAAKPYIISFWSTGNLNVAGGILRTSGPTINGFTYYEYVIQNSSTVTVSGSAIVDELRLYPKMSRMTTVSYDPFIGKTSECDESNRVTYYEYDERARIRYIKDEKKNVLKVYEYQNSFKPNNRVYYNNAISEIFKANNCQGDYVGKEITYSIAAKKYSSNISQADADSKAQEELNNQGQAAANNAGCSPLYFNDQMSQTFYKEDCPDGYKSAPVTYSVAARKYSSLISKEDANSMAQDEIDANGDNYATLNGTCVIDNEGQWQADDPATQRCGSGNMAGHREMYMKDINPNSTTYNTWRWIDLGVDVDGCPVTGPINLISNGDFEQGEAGFLTEYDLVSVSSQNASGKCSISTNPRRSNGQWCDHGDHTSGNGNMLVVDASTSAPTKSFWYTIANVQPNTNYVFSFWCMNLYSSNPPTIQLNINDNQVLLQSIPSTTCTWQQYSVSWNSGSNTVANVDLIAPLGQSIGNDFAIDDISLKKQ